MSSFSRVNSGVSARSDPSLGEGSERLNGRRRSPRNPLNIGDCFTSLKDIVTDARILLDSIEKRDKAKKDAPLKADAEELRSLFKKTTDGVDELFLQSESWDYHPATKPRRGEQLCAITRFYHPNFEQTL